MQTSRKIEAQITPAYFQRALRDRYVVPVGERMSPLDIVEAIKRIEEDEILFEARNIPTIGGSGVGQAVADWT